MTAAKSCTECGAAEAGVTGLCLDCLTHDKAQEMASISHRFALEVLREADRAEAIQELKTAAAQAGADLAAVQAQTAGLESAVLEAVTAERAAADRAREAEEFRRRCEEDEHRAQRDQASPEAQTAAIGKLRDAGTVAAREQAAAEGATGIREQAETVLSAHRARLQGLEDAAGAARTAAENPPDHVPVSMSTALIGHPAYLILAEDPGDEGLPLVAAAVRIHAQACGVADTLRAEGRAQAREQARQDAMTRPRVLDTDQLNRGTVVLPPTAPLPGGWG